MQKNCEKETSLIERLLYYVISQGSNFNKLALNIGVSNSYFSKMRRNRGSVGSDIIEQILLYYDNLNADWLLTGRGNMLKEQPDRNFLKHFAEESYVRDYDKIQLLLIEKDERIKELKESIETQKILIEQLMKEKELKLEN